MCFFEVLLRSQTLPAAEPSFQGFCVSTRLDVLELPSTFSEAGHWELKGGPSCLTPVEDLHLWLWSRMYTSLLYIHIHYIYIYILCIFFLYLSSVFVCILSFRGGVRGGHGNGWGGLSGWQPGACHTAPSGGGICPKPMRERVSSKTVFHE